MKITKEKVFEVLDDFITKVVTIIYIKWRHFRCPYRFKKITKFEKKMKECKNAFDGHYGHYGHYCYDCGKRKKLKRK